MLSPSREGNEHAGIESLRSRLRRKSNNVFLARHERNPAAHKVVKDTSDVVRHQWAVQSDCTSLRQLLVEVAQMPRRGDSQAVET